MTSTDRPDHSPGNRPDNRPDNPPYDIFGESADDLLTPGGADPLDTGYSPPETEPRAARLLAEGEEHESLDERLAEEEPEVWDEDSETSDTTRAGRIEAVNDGAGAQDLWAMDDGVDGGGASAEEAALHIVDE